MGARISFARISFGSAERPSALSVCRAGRRPAGDVASLAAEVGERELNYGFFVFAALRVKATGSWKGQARLVRLRRHPVQTATGQGRRGRLHRPEQSVLLSGRGAGAVPEV
jgi:hypothetical protein